MTREITTEDLLRQDGPELAKDVDRLAMALCEALLENTKAEASVNSATNEHLASYATKVKEIRGHLSADNGHLTHLLYWFDVRAEYWHKTAGRRSHDVVHALEQLLLEAQTIKNALDAATNKDRPPPSSTPAEVLQKIVELVRLFYGADRPFFTRLETLLSKSHPS